MARKHRPSYVAKMGRLGAADAPTFSYRVFGFGLAIGDQDFGKLPATCEAISQARTLLLNSLKSGRDIAAIIPTFVMDAEFGAQIRRMATAAGYKLV